MLFLLIIILLSSSFFLLALALIPFFQGKLKAWKEKRDRAVQVELDKLFYNKNPKRIARFYFILPFAMGFLGFVCFGGNILAAAAGVFLGLVIPNIIFKSIEAQRKSKFANQILDMIMVISSSLKGGLSLLQALEVVVEMMPSPMRQEIALVINENKMGVALEDSLKHLNERMNSEELTCLVNAVLVARETGGDLTKVLSRLSISIRDNQKLKDNIKTLTMQGKLQGLIMSALPFLFVAFVMSTNPKHFDIMLQSELGRMLLILAVFLQVIGMFLIHKFSSINL